jgi:hypothetical protein
MVVGKPKYPPKAAPIQTQSTALSFDVTADGTRIAIRRPGCFELIRDLAGNGQLRGSTVNSNQNESRPGALEIDPVAGPLALS